jgi:hypothetical protein
MKHNFVKNLIDGAKSVLVVFYHDDYQYPDRKGFSKDLKNLSSDIRTVGKGMKRTVTKYNS